MYTEETKTEITTKFDAAVRGLRALQLQCVDEGNRCDSKEVYEYLVYGTGRRISILHHAIQNIFRLFPITATRPVPRDDIVNANINLHSFVVNVWGFFDNLAWAYLFRRGFIDKFRDRRKIGMFRREVHPVLPKNISDYLNTPRMLEWQRRYLTDYRDALAHRIPLYIPPAVWTKEDAERYHQLQREIRVATLAHKFDEVDKLRQEEDALGIPCFSFNHSFLGEGLKNAVALHAQIVADSLTVNEFGSLYFAHWLDDL